MRGVAHVEGSLIAVADKTEHRDGLYLMGLSWASKTRPAKCSIRNMGRAQL